MQVPMLFVNKLYFVCFKGRKTAVEPKNCLDGPVSVVWPIGFIFFYHNFGIACHE